MNLNIIPKMDSKTAKGKHENHKNRWKNFARKMQKNPFMKGYAVTQNNHKCSWCEKPLKKFQLHHVDYDHLCIYNESIQLPNPTEKRPNRKIQVPDCAYCKLNTPEAFNECFKRVVPVHQYCNKLINDEMNY